MPTCVIPCAPARVKCKRPMWLSFWAGSARDQGWRQQQRVCRWAALPRSLAAGRTEGWQIEHPGKCGRVQVCAHASTQACVHHAHTHTHIHAHTFTHARRSRYRHLECLRGTRLHTKPKRNQMCLWCPASLPVAPCACVSCLWCLVRDCEPLQRAPPLPLLLLPLQITAVGRGTIQQLAAQLVSSHMKYQAALCASTAIAASQG